MAARLEVLHRPAPTADYTRQSQFRAVGIAVGLIGLGLAVVALIANLVAAGDVGDGTSTRETLAWSFGLNVTAFGTIKVGIALILMGVLIRLWMRVESMKAALPQLMPSARAEANPSYGDVKTPFGPAVETATAPPPLLIHRMAPKLWAPMLAMGAMLVPIGFVLSIVQAGTSNTSDFQTLSAWVQGLQFLGEAMLLSAISFLLGSILGGLRSGGGEVQESVGVVVRTLKMPPSAMAFVALMAAGVMVSIAQFVLYVIAGAQDDQAAWFAWLGPLREVGLALILSGIVLALFTISRVLGAQFSRITEIVTAGR
jgi:hypothetical protein